MGIYDSLVLHDSIELPGFPFESSHRELRDGERRVWQTKDLNPSMDMYAILPRIQEHFGELKFGDTQDLYLYRRHPPVTYWTTENRGPVGDEYPDDIVYDADHWRSVRYTGTIEISASAEDAVLYTFEIELENGLVRNIEQSSVYSATDGVYPPRYMEVVDINYDGEATYDGTSVSEIAERFYSGEDLDVPDEELGLVLTFYQTRTLDGNFPDFNSFFDNETEPRMYKGKTVKEWLELIYEDEDDLTDRESDTIELYNSIKRDIEFMEQEEE